MDKRFPIGQLEIPEHITQQHVREWVADIQTYVQDLKKAVTNLSERELQSTYREGSFTVAQLVHHIADSQLNLYQRLKLALTDDHPNVAEFKQDAWVTLADGQLPIDVAIQLLDALNQRVSAIGQHLSAAQLERGFELEGSGTITVGETIAKLRWHERHHLAHIQCALGQFIPESE
ncbi:YfiT family bacillithiol transferase [Staphylococcus lutrae]|uniref:Metal-dependent hydrolase n=1 Tax=Staphylococcus lutrae TaxID=155085 RepID=A0AAC9WK07_9STAP|nr:putative metal-dependent hydrolase [Staphylococcus lutrae]ARJ51990.1 metal-dependent hydrolase [Staphylococcus lutrae]PNZ34012.1 metal-dependent hydrolase [Staphylococcus lutrae]